MTKLKEVRSKDQDSTDKIFEGENGNLYRIRLEPLNLGSVTAAPQFRMTISQANNEQEGVRQLATNTFAIAPAEQLGGQNVAEQITGHIASMVQAAENNKLALESAEGYLREVWGIDPTQDNTNGESPRVDAPTVEYLSDNTQDHYDQDEELQQ